MNFSFLAMQSFYCRKRSFRENKRELFTDILFVCSVPHSSNITENSTSDIRVKQLSVLTNTESCILEKKFPLLSFINHVSISLKPEMRVTQNKIRKKYSLLMQNKMVYFLNRTKLINLIIYTKLQTAEIL